MSIPDKRKKKKKESCGGITAAELAARRRWSERKDDTRKTPLSNPGLRYDTSKSYPNSPFFDMVEQPKPKDGLTCSFCGADVPRVHATVGKAIRGWITPINDDSLFLTRKIRVSADDVVACPAHSLRVSKPKFTSLEDQ